MENGPQPDFEVTFYNGVKCNHSSSKGTLEFKIPRTGVLPTDPVSYETHRFDILKKKDLNIPPFLLSLFQHVQQCIRQCLDIERTSKSDSNVEYPLVLKSSNCQNKTDSNNSTSKSSTSPVPSVHLSTVSKQSTAKSHISQVTSNQTASSHTQQRTATASNDSTTLYSSESLKRDYTGHSAMSNVQSNMTSARSSVPSRFSTPSYSTGEDKPKKASRFVFLEKIGWCRKEVDGEFVMLFLDGVQITIYAKEHSLIYFDAKTHSGSER
jgi:hypothetical protein